jgi:hypothetical protein
VDKHLLVVEMGHGRGRVLLGGGLADAALAVKRYFSHHFFSILLINLISGGKRRNRMFFKNNSIDTSYP